MSINERALNQIIEDYKKYCDEVTNVTHTKMSKEIIEEMIQASNTYTYMQELENFYEDKEDETDITWQDIEGEGYGWVWVDNPPEKWHQLLQERMSDYLEYVSKRIETEPINVVKVTFNDSTNDAVEYCIIDRESRESDLIYVFSNKELSPF